MFIFNMGFKNKDVISIKDFSKEELVNLFEILRNKMTMDLDEMFRKANFNAME